MAFYPVLNFLNTKFLDTIKHFQKKYLIQTGEKSMMVMLAARSYDDEALELNMAVFRTSPTK